MIPAPEDEERCVFLGLDAVAKINEGNLFLRRRSEIIAFLFWDQSL